MTPRPIIPDTTKRDAVLAGLAGLLVLGFIVYGFFHFMTMTNQTAAATVTGVVVEKQFTPAPEQQISFGRKGLKAKEIDGEYVLKVRVEAENRTFDVPVEKSVYDGKKVGETLTFLRPASERE